MIDCRHSPTLHSCFWAGEPGPAVLQSTELPDQRLLRVDGGDTVQPTPALGGLALLLCPKAERMQVRERNLTS